MHRPAHARSVPLASALAIALLGASAAAMAQPPAGPSAPGADAPRAASPTQQRPSARPRREPDPRFETLARLRKPIDLNVADARLEDVFTFIEQVAEVTIEPMWLDDRFAVGFDKDRRVSVNVKAASALGLLERIVDRASDQPGDATWQLTPEGTIEVGPKSRLNARATLKIYDIQDMLFTVPDFPNVPELDLDTILQQGSQRGGGGGGGGVFQDDDQETPEALEEETAQRIIDILVENVEPEQWDVNGGDGATVRYFRGTLIVRAPDYIHRQLGGYTPGR